MKTLLKSVTLAASAFLLLSPVYAKDCGVVMGKTIEITKGNLSCKKAKKVYKAFVKGKIPKGWNCGQSVGGCGNEKQEFTFR